MPAIRINTNIFSLQVQRQVGLNSLRLGESLERLSSGMRVGNAADDAAALTVSINLRADIAVMEQAIRNTKDSISLLNIAEVGVNSNQEMLIRMRELAIEASTATLASGQRASIDQEFTALKTEIDRISLTTQFDGRYLLNGNLRSGAATTLNVQIGIGNDANTRINLNTAIDLTNIDTTSLGIHLSDIRTSTASLSALDAIDQALQTISTSRGKIGAVQNRLEMTIRNLEDNVLNVSAADSNLRSVDMAMEISNFTRNQIVMQSSVSMLSQANLIPQTVLQLLR